MGTGLYLGMKKISSQTFGPIRAIIHAGLLALYVSINFSNTESHAGSVVVWGYDFMAPTNIPPGLTNVIAVSAGFGQCLALRDDGTVVGWGSNMGGLTNVPPDLTNVIAIAMGLSNSMALKADGTVAVWGYNNFGPVFVPPGLTNIVAIASGCGESLVLRDDGTLLSWGREPGFTAVQSNVVATSQSISVGSTHGLALRRDGTIHAWGDNGAGQCEVPGDLKNVVAVTAGEGYSLALQADGTVVGWGNYLPWYVAPTNVAAISSAGGSHYALKADGTIEAWGSMPMEPPAGLTNVLAVSAGQFHAVAAVGDGPPVLAAPVTDLQKDGDALALSLPTQSGRVYGLEYSGSLNDTNWSPLPLRPGNGGSQTLTDPAATNSARFYRVRQW